MTARSMNAVAVARDGTNAVQLLDVAVLALDDVAGGRGVLVRVVCEVWALP